MAQLGTRRGIAVGAFVLALAAGLWHAPGAFVDTFREVGRLRSESVEERELGGARRVDLDTRVFLEARRLIPEDARYLVVTGPGVDVSTPVTLSAAAPFAGYWLLPRRRVLGPRDADWVVSYGGDLRGLGLEYARIVTVSEGIELAEVRR